MSIWKKQQDFRYFGDEARFCPDVGAIIKTTRFLQWNLCIRSGFLNDLPRLHPSSELFPVVVNLSDPETNSFCGFHKCTNFTFAEFTSESVSSLTRLFVEHDLVLKLLALLQGFPDAEDDAFARLGPKQELAGAALLHDLGPGKARELAEAIGAVDDGKALRHLSVGQDEVAVCRREGETWGGRQGAEVMTLFWEGGVVALLTLRTHI